MAGFVITVITQPESLKMIFASTESAHTVYLLWADFLHTVSERQRYCLEPITDDQSGKHTPGTPNRAGLKREWVGLIVCTESRKSRLLKKESRKNRKPPRKENKTHKTRPIKKSHRKYNKLYFLLSYWQDNRDYTGHLCRKPYKTLLVKEKG